MSQAFVFTRNRIHKLASGEVHQGFPSDFYFGAVELRESGMDCALLELAEPAASSPFRRVKYRIVHELVGRSTGIGVHAPRVTQLLGQLEQCAWVTGVGDAVALGLAMHKREGNLSRPKLRMFAMGLMNRLWQLERRHPWVAAGVIKTLSPLFAEIDDVCFLGRAEQTYFASKFPKLSDRARFVGFAVDLEFWHPAPSPQPRSGYLFVGNDANRDFDRALACALRLPNEKFTFVSNGFREKALPKNVTLHDGSMHAPALTDQQLRELYQNSRAVILPLKETLQPSGQSVALQALACQTPVLLSKVRGSDFFWSFENLHLIPNDSFVDDVARLSREIPPWSPRRDRTMTEWAGQFLGSA